jgi:hypothetical protein
VLLLKTFDLVGFSIIGLFNYFAHHIQIISYRTRRAQLMIDISPIVGNPQLITAQLLSTHWIVDQFLLAIVFSVHLRFKIKSL